MLDHGKVKDWLTTAVLGLLVTALGWAGGIITRPLVAPDDVSYRIRYEELTPLGFDMQTSKRLFERLVELLGGHRQRFDAMNEVFVRFAGPPDGIVAGADSIYKSARTNRQEALSDSAAITSLRLLPAPSNELEMLSIAGAMLGREAQFWRSVEIAALAVVRNGYTRALADSVSMAGYRFYVAHAGFTEATDANVRAIQLKTDRVYEVLDRFSEEIGRSNRRRSIASAVFLLSLYLCILILVYARTGKWPLSVSRRSHLSTSPPSSLADAAPARQSQGEDGAP